MISKYPFILCHGIAHKRILFYRPFGRIFKYLKSNGFEVFISNQDGFGSIESNACQIKKFIDYVCKQTNCTKVNIIAHSKGGLDCRYLINQLGDKKIASLTTLSTPHYGSSMADNVLKLPSWTKRFVAFWINLIYRICGDKHPNALITCQQLSEDYLKKFNQKIIDSNNVYYQSYAAKLDSPKHDFIMGVPWILTRYWQDDDSDGLVSFSSAIWGDFKGRVLQESVSHTELIGFVKDKEKMKRLNMFYLQLCLELIEKGY